MFRHTFLKYPLILSTKRRKLRASYNPKYNLLKERAKVYISMNEGIRLLIRRYKALKLAEKINSIADKNLGEKSLTEALFSIRDEEG